MAAPPALPPRLCAVPTPAPPPRLFGFLFQPGLSHGVQNHPSTLKGGEDRESLEYVIGICLVINDHPGLQIYAMNSHFVFWGIDVFKCSALQIEKIPVRAST